LLFSDSIRVRRLQALSGHW